MNPEDRRHVDRRHDGRPGGRRATDPQPEWLSVSDYARVYGVDRGVVYKWLRAEILEVYRVERILRIRNIPPDGHRPRRTVVDGR